MDAIMEMVHEKIAPKWLIIAIAIWLVAYLICFIAGGFALRKYGEKNGYHKKILPWLLGVQIYCEALFAGRSHTARRIQNCLWWWLVTAAGCGATAIWLMAGFMGVEGVPLSLLKFLLIVLATVLVFLYILIRGDELSVLKRIFPNPLWKGLWVAGAILCIPVHRIFLLFIKEE